MDYALQREKIQKAVDEAALMFEGCGLDVSKEVWANENTISEDEKEVVYVCGAVCVSCPGASADDALFLDIDTTQNKQNNRHRRPYDLSPYANILYLGEHSDSCNNRCQHQ